MENEHGYAVTIEMALRDLLNCERGALFGLVDADRIERDWQTSIIGALMFLYAKCDTKTTRDIEDFMEENKHYLRYTIKDLLKVVDDISIKDGNPNTVEPYKTGVEIINKVTEKIKNIGAKA